jgi:hypothetical protein
MYLQKMEPGGGGQAILPRQWEKFFTFPSIGYMTIEIATNWLKNAYRPSKAILP